MNIWFILWVFLTIFVFGLFFWSMLILFSQKKAWRIVAEKLKLGFDGGKLTTSPSLSGSLKSLPLSVYSEEQTINENGTKRYRTIFQFQLPVQINTSGVIASHDARNFALSLAVKDEVKMEQTSLNPSITVRADNAEPVLAYLTEDKCKSLNAIMAISGIACILIFDENATFLRFETPDAFNNAQKLERFLVKAAEHAKVLSA